MPRRVSLPGAAELFRTTPAQDRAGQRDNGRTAEDQPSSPGGPHSPDGTATPGSTTTQDTTGATPAVEELAEERVEAPARRPGRGDPSPGNGAEAASAETADTTDDEAAAAAARSPITPEQRTGRRSGTGRVRHDEKITVYVSNDELLDLERARLSLRAEHRMAVDRGRIVRAALAMALGDLAERGGDSELVRRLTQP